MRDTTKNSYRLIYSIAWLTLNIILLWSNVIGYNKFYTLVFYILCCCWAYTVYYYIRKGSNYAKKKRSNIR